MPSIDSQTTRLPCAKRRFFHVSVNGFQLIARSGATAGVTGIARLTSQPATATAIASAPASTGPFGSTATSRPPAIVPSRIATNVPISTRPLPPTSSSVLQRLRQDRVLDRAEQRRVHAHQRQRGEQQRAGCAARSRRSRSTMIAISNSLMKRMSRDFSYLSASWPAVAESSTNGSDEHRGREVDERVGVDRRQAAPRGRRRR